MADPATIAIVAKATLAAVDYVWNGGTLSDNVPDDFRGHLDGMRSCFDRIEYKITLVSSLVNDGGVDSERIKYIFYAIYFGNDDLDSVDITSFVDCFADTRAT